MYNTSTSISAFIPRPTSFISHSSAPADHPPDNPFNITYQGTPPPQIKRHFADVHLDVFAFTKFPGKIRKRAPYEHAPKITTFIHTEGICLCQIHKIAVCFPQTFHMLALAPNVFALAFLGWACKKKKRVKSHTSDQRQNVHLQISLFKEGFLWH